jgi:hypothetical protein
MDNAEDDPRAFHRAGPPFGATDMDGGLGGAPPGIDTFLSMFGYFLNTVGALEHHKQWVFRPFLTEE